MGRVRSKTQIEPPQGGGTTGVGCVDRGIHSPAGHADSPVPSPRLDPPGPEPSRPSPSVPTDGASRIAIADGRPPDPPGGADRAAGRHHHDRHPGRPVRPGAGGATSRIGRVGAGTEGIAGSGPIGLTRLEHRIGNRISLVCVRPSVRSPRPHPTPRSPCVIPGGRDSPSQDRAKALELDGKGESAPDPSAQSRRMGKLNSCWSRAPRCSPGCPVQTTSGERSRS